MGEVKRVERKELLVGDDRIGDGGRVWVGRVNGESLHGIREPETTVAGKLVAVKFLHE